MEQQSGGEESLQLIRTEVRGVETPAIPRAIDAGLQWLRSRLLDNFYQDNRAFFIRCGMIGLYSLAALLVLAAALVLPIRYDFVGFGDGVLVALAVPVVLAILQYTAWKFLPSIDALVERNPVRVSSYAFFHLMAMFTAIGLVATAVAGIVLWIARGEFSIFVMAFFTVIFLAYMLYFLLNPATLAVREDPEAGAASTVIGLVSFSVKAYIALIPILMGTSIIIANLYALGILFSTYQWQQELTQAGLNVMYYAGAALLPIIGYFLYLFYFFLIDIVRSILDVPMLLRELIQKQ